MDKAFDNWCVRPLPDGSRVVLSSRYFDRAWHSLYDTSHNIVRFAADGTLQWQVRRDERGQYDYDRQRKEAIRAGLDGPFNPFLKIEDGFWLQYRVPYEGQSLVPGLKLITFSYVHTMPDGLPYGRTYELDIETGIAVNITPPSNDRSW